MPADHYIMDADMKKVADAIRTKGQTTAPLTFPDGMVQAVNDIQVGGGHEDEDAIISRTITEYTNDRVTAIGTHAFSQSSYLKNIHFPNVLEIGVGAFDGIQIERLGDENFPKAYNIKSQAFSECGKMTDVKLSSARYIGSSSFSSCNSLVSAEFPGAERIDAYAFSGDSALYRVKLVQRRVVQLGNNCFKSNVNIYVPRSLVEKYKTATNWVQYASKIHPDADLLPRTWTISDFNEDNITQYTIKSDLRPFFQIGDSFDVDFGTELKSVDAEILGLRVSGTKLVGTITGGIGRYQSFGVRNVQNRYIVIKTFRYDTIVTPQ